MGKKILTLDSLYQFFVEQNKTINFSSKESKTPIVVTTNGYFEADDSEMPGMQKLELKVCHTKTNRNGSHISDTNMEKAMPTLKYRPILAYIHELEDGTKDFYAHNMEIIENEDGEAEINYIEKQVGCFTADEPWLKYDEKQDKTYVHAYAVIPEGYTEAADIVRRKGGTKVSCELVINELSYNAKEKYLDITDFYFGGCTLLGVDEDGNEIGEGMLGARADISDFCYKEPVFTYKENKLIEVLDKLNTTLANFNTNTTQKGGEDMNKFEELLAKYNVTAEDVTFEIEGLSDEELEAKFVEAFEGDGDDGEGADNGEGDEGTDGEGTGEGDGNVEEGAGDDAGDNDGEGSDDGDGAGEEKFTKIFTVELSHDDIRYALYNLISQYDEEDNDYYGIRAVYDNYFIMYGWINNKLYKVGYSVDGENVSLEGERHEVFEMILTESEKLAIEKMREDYSALEEKYNELKTFKDNYDAAELKAQKDAVFAKAEYGCLVENEEFATLKADAEKYSVEEISTKADLIFAAHMKSTMEFSANHEEIAKPKVVGINFSAKERTKKPYGNLFDK
jgi:hypothetical protein